MADDVIMVVGNERIESFLGYSIDADIYAAASGWRFELDPTTHTSVQRGQQCSVEVGGQRVLTGVVDKVSRGYSKTGRTLVVEGRDLLGVAVDTYCTEFRTLAGKTLAEVADELLRTCAYLERSQVIYGETAFNAESAQDQAQIEPGETVFGVLRRMAQTRGLMVYCLADGTVVLDRPVSGLASRYRIRVKDGRNDSAVLTARVVRDASREYSTIQVIGQRQDVDDAGFNVSSTLAVEGAAFPKSYVVVHNGDGQSPEAVARMVAEQHRAAAQQVTYTVSGHTQTGDPWQIDELVYVWDDELNILGEQMLITGRTLELSKSRGRTTRLRLGPPGVVQ
jgi:prophage tail gpP-like protein